MGRSNQESIILKHTEEKVYRVHYKDLEDFITRAYRQSYEIVAYEELHNYTSKSISLKREKLEPEDREDLHKFITTGKGQFILNTLMQDCVNADLIPEGNYIIDIFW